ncbi:MAG: LuxR C-terminal-related transcriptional regulator [Beutenbergiaceae bacterium]
MTFPVSNLSSEDAATVLEAWSQLWPPGADFRVRLARILRDMTRAEVVTITSFDIQTGQRQLQVEPKEWEADIQERRSQTNSILSQHPVARQMLESGGTGAMRLSDHIDLDRWRESQLFRDYYQPLGLTWEITLPIPTDGGRVTIITVNSTNDFSDPAADFTSRDLALCTALVPMAALGLGGLTEGTPDPWVSMAAGWCLVRLDGARRVTHVSPPDTEGVLVPGVVLPPEATCTATAKRETIGRMQLSDGEWIVQHVGGSEVDQIIAVRRQRAVSSEVSRLTERQGEVLELVAQGHTNSQIASALGIAEGTVRKHLETIFAQLAVPNRAAASAMWYANDAHVPRKR